MKTAHVFTDSDGFVTSENGLSELIKNLQQAKFATKPAISIDEINAFLNPARFCRDEWSDIRSSYFTEMQAAEASGCSKCKKSSITKKYVKALYEKSKS